MADSFSKKENKKKKIQKLKDKALRREERKLNNNKGKELDELFVYVDENGQLTDTPPDPNKEVLEIKLEDIQLGAAPIEAEDLERKGTVTFYNDEKGYGFISDHKSNENIFVHVNQLTEEIKKGDKVTFEKERGPKGYVATNVNKVNK